MGNVRLIHDFRSELQFACHNRSAAECEGKLGVCYSVRDVRYGLANIDFRILQQKLDWWGLKKSGEKIISKSIGTKCSP